jgi:small subunit ribosomal protein S7
VAKLINAVMSRGKKTVAQKIVYGMLEVVREKTKQNPLEVFDTALKNVAPVVEVKSRRVGGSNYQVPIPVRPERRLQLAYRWIIGAAQAAKGRPMREKLASEIMAAANNEGAAIKKKQDVHRMAEANRAFAHFAR